MNQLCGPRIAVLMNQLGGPRIAVLMNQLGGPRIAVLGGLLIGVILAHIAPARAQHQHHQPAALASAPAAPPQASSTRLTMEELHAAGGVPPGWRFTLPPGDAQAGRKVFVDFKCYACHAVKGEQFPGESSTAGPELTGMGGHHPAEYLAESIVNPSAVVVDAPGYAGGDGRSIMPPIPDMTIGQIVDLVAYLKSLSASAHGHAHEAAREQTAGAYRVRLAYRQAGGDHSGHVHGGSTMQMAAAAGRLMVFVSDAVSGQPIAYVPVTAKIEIEGKPAQARKLAPMIGAEGLYYGADVVLPARTKRITLSVGPSTAQVAAGAPEGLKRRETVAFDWQ